ncbi:type II toxin-antitoxin system RelE/ParE family toxin [Argonema antarcticum]|uniref:type II toxin-antitoxin system RelE/ParE family toxin n=1 Tax=Argonema antarcticum TaxID=2942763 RepID=UPI002012325A|nr:type II toxin-antitoxin system RelE/ParE family toxin [Argonema antarcticum]MCL1471803.1 type II toxin-antitoxin system RelE/ParE family toxin [Argonema antarcticum A004/B2]
MNYKLQIQPEAELDLTEAYRWYEERSQGLGSEFLTAVDSYLFLIQSNPLAYPVVYEQAHRALLRKFPYGIFYLIEDDTIVVIACFHAKRDPQSLQNRV